MKKSLLIVVVILSVIPATAQISGWIVDDHQEVISFANVVLLRSSDTSFVTGVSTTEDGQFFIEHRIAGNYHLRISSIGYETADFIAVDLQDGIQIDVGTIVLKQGSAMLKEVVVTSKKDIIQQTAFGKVVNVQSSLLTKGSNALQILERLPGVVTDRQNNTFSLNGQMGVTVLINGRRVLLSPSEVWALLENTLGDNIEKVELISSPSSRHDADGGAGIINIVLSKGIREKSRLAFTTMAGYGFGEKASTSLSYQKYWKKLSLSGSYGYVRDVRRSGFAGSGTSSKPAILGGKSSGVFSTFSRAFQNGHNLNMNVEYQLAGDLTIGADLIFSSAQNRNLSSNNVAWDTEEFGYLAMKGLSDGKSHRDNLMTSVFLNKEWNRNRLNLDISMLNYSNDNPSMIDPDYFDRNGNTLVSPSEIYTNGIRGQSLSRIKVGVAKFDFERPMGSLLDLEAGAKVSYSDNRNDSNIESLINGIWRTDMRSQSLVVGKEEMLAGYGQLNWKVGAKNTLRFGLRYEFWERESNMEEEPYRISGLFPTFLFSREFREGRSFSLG